MAPSHPSPFTLGVAVFVKTPRISPVKTRLAKTVGTHGAHDFYRLSCKTIAKTLANARSESLGTIQPFWAVAEENVDEQWSEFSVIQQGPGELGAKLNHVYSSLLQRFTSVALIGADTPQLTVKDLITTRETLQLGNEFVVGPAKDGGFYLFAGRHPIAPHQWLNTPYSQSNTLEKLLEGIKKIGKVTFLQQYTDVDNFEDLKDFLLEAKKAESHNSDQKALIDFVSALVDSN